MARMSNAKGNSKSYPEAHRRAARLYQERHRKLGLCVKCPRPAVADRLFCVVHREYRGLRRRWSAAEDSILRVAWLEQVPAGEIATTLGRPKVAVLARRRLLGLPTRSGGTAEVGSP